MSLRRMRSIPDALAEIRALDEKTAVTPYCIRTLCNGRRVRCIHTGRKILVDLDDLIRYLNESEFDNIQDYEKFSDNSHTCTN